jgi:hypothetical protein
LSHADNQCLGLSFDTRTAWLAPVTSSVFAGDQLAMPGKKRFPA